MNRIRALRQSCEMSQSELAGALCVAQNTVSNWENGNRTLDADTLLRIAELFGVSSDYVMGKEKRGGVKIPVLGYIRAGIPNDAVEEILDYEEIDEETAKSGEFFALRIRGESMEPRMQENDVVIVRKQEEVENGEIGIVLVGGNDATVKRVRKTKDGIMLIPQNPSFEPIFYSKAEVISLPVQIIGKVVELRAKF